jgi:ABC-2 type transport system ATP-binding protein
MNSLVLKNLNKSYTKGVKALDNISLELNNGMFGLLGPNGAGKSSLMRSIACLQSVDEGEMFFNNVDIINDPMHLKKNLGFLPQDFGVYPKIKAYDLLNHIALLKGITHKSEREEQINTLLQKVNLHGHRKKEVYSFSGGMKQRFGIAQALLGDPKIIIVDEPTAGLDPEERYRFNGLLGEIGENIIIVLSTHLVEDVKMLCPKMAIMLGGKIVAQGRPSDFIENLKGRLWQKRIDKNAMEGYERDYHILSKQYSIGQLTIIVLEDQCPLGFEAINPSLEDAYFSYIKA